VTKGLQEIHLDKHIRLLDSPGIVFASGEGAPAAALRNAIKVRGRWVPWRCVTCVSHVCVSVCVCVTCVCVCCCVTCVCVCVCCARTQQTVHTQC
jgi:hypothetical protein